MCRSPSAGRSSPWWCPMRRGSRRRWRSWCAGADDTGGGGTGRQAARIHHEMRKWRKAVGVALFVSALAPSPALAQVPRSASLATHAVGSLYNAIGTGIATVLSRHTPMTVRVQPFAGPPAWLPSMNEGETEMVVLTSADAVTSYKGIILYKRPFKNTRILLVGGALQLGFYVPKDSPIDMVA